jgi:adenylate cyclase
MARAKTSHEIFEQSDALMRRAIEIDPSYPEPYASLGMSRTIAYVNGWTDDPERALIEAESFVERALQIDPQNVSAHFVAGQVAGFRRDFARWAAEVEMVLSLSPNSAAGHWALGQISIYSGRPLEAITPLEWGMRLDPALGSTYLHFLGLAHLLAGNYEKAAALFKERIRLKPETDFARAFLAAALGHLGEIDEARRIWAEIRTINPKYSFAAHIGRLPFQNRADVERIAGGLSKAGLPQ